GRGASWRARDRPPLGPPARPIGKAARQAETRTDIGRELAGRALPPSGHPPLSRSVDSPGRLRSNNPFPPAWRGRSLAFPAFAASASLAPSGWPARYRRWQRGAPRERLRPIVGSWGLRSAYGEPMRMDINW